MIYIINVRKIIKGILNNNNKENNRKECGS